MNLDHKIGLWLIVVILCSLIIVLLPLLSNKQIAASNALTTRGDTVNYSITSRYYCLNILKINNSLYCNIDDIRGG